MSVYEPSFIQLTTLGSRTVRIAATPGVLGGSAVTLWIHCDHRVWNSETASWEPERTAYALSAEQARDLVAQIEAAVASRG